MGTHCGLCNRNGRTTPMLTRYPGAAPICPKCDRLACPKCERVLIDGNEQRCPGCGCDIAKAFKEKKG